MSVCTECGESLHVGSFPFCPHGPVSRHYNTPTTHTSERCVVYQHPLTGKTVYPPRNDLPMPKRYIDNGYIRKELPTLKSIHDHEKSSNVLNEKAHFDSGTGRGFDNNDPPDLPDDVKEMIKKGQISVKIKDGPAPL